jgi:hypothetical protein
VPGRAGTHSCTLRRPRKELGWDQAAICSTCVHISSRIATILSFCLAQRNKKRQDKLGVLGYTPIPSCAAVLNASRLRRDVWFFIIKLKEEEDDETSVAQLLGRNATPFLAAVSAHRRSPCPAPPRRGIWRTSRAAPHRCL